VNPHAATFFSEGQVRWAEIMLSAHRDGLAALKETLCSRLEELFPHLDELDCEQDTPLEEDPTIKAVITGCLIWENSSDGQAFMTSWDEADRADGDSVSVLAVMLDEIKDIRIMTRAAGQAIWQEEKRLGIHDSGNLEQEKSDT
jgi:hypothetical protein